jgi:hypothetical protein
MEEDDRFASSCGKRVEVPRVIISLPATFAILSPTAAHFFPPYLSVSFPFTKHTTQTQDTRHKLHDVRCVVVSCVSFHSLRSFSPP